MTLEERIENARSDFQHSPRQPTLLTALKTKHADPFSEATRQLALQADIINNQAEKIARLEEVLASTRAQCENFLAQREMLGEQLAALERALLSIQEQVASALKIG